MISISLTVTSAIVQCEVPSIGLNGQKTWHLYSLGIIRTILRTEWSESVGKKWYTLPLTNIWLNLNDFLQILQFQRLIAHEITFDTELTRLTSATKFVIDLFSANHSDYLNLKSLFHKFPDEQLGVHITAITSFPQNIAGLPKRLLVYYLGKWMAFESQVNNCIQTETPIDNISANCAVDCLSFKRYVMVQSLELWDIFGEIDWRHDNGSYRCVQLSSVVDAAISLNDLRQKDDVFVFNLLEFFGEQFSISLLHVNDVGIEKWLNVKNGTIASLFNCSDSGENISDLMTDRTPSPDHWPNTTPKTQSSKQWILWLTLSLIILITILMIAAFMAYLFLNDQSLKESSISEKQIQISDDNALKSVTSIESKSYEDVAKPSNTDSLIEGKPTAAQTNDLSVKSTRSVTIIWWYLTISLSRNIIKCLILSLELECNSIEHFRYKTN